MVCYSNLIHIKTYWFFKNEFHSKASECMYSVFATSVLIKGLLRLNQGLTQGTLIELIPDWLWNRDPLAIAWLILVVPLLKFCTVNAYNLDKSTLDNDIYQYTSVWMVNWHMLQRMDNWIWSLLQALVN